MNNMKYLKSFILIILISFICSITAMRVSAHNSNLGIEGNNDITYDPCDPVDYVNSSDIGDGYDERCYNLVKGTIDKGTTPNTYNPTTMYHIDNDIIFQN